MAKIDASLVLSNVGEPGPGPALDTLATSPTLYTTPLEKRARSKYASRAIGTALADHAKSVGSPMEKAYRSTIYCAEKIEQENGTLESRYCGHRWCPVCARIRTARAIELYGPEIEAWPARWMVTLTAPTVPGDQLGKQPDQNGEIVLGEIDKRLHVFQNCCLSLRRKGIPVRGIRKLEVTYNPETDRFHPHFHILCDNEETARELKKAWLKRIPEADPRAQHVEQADQGSVVELLKYSCKMTTPTRQKGSKEFVALSALDIIFRALKGRRIYQTLGFTLAGAEELESEELEVSGMAATKRATETITWSWAPEVTDWVDRATGETLTGYVPRQKYIRFVEGIGKSNNGNDTHLTLIESSLPAG